MTHKIEADKQPLRSDGSTQTIPRGLSRRDLLACATGGALLGGGVLAGARWNEWGWRASTFIGRAQIGFTKTESGRANTASFAR